MCEKIRLLGVVDTELAFDELRIGDFLISGRFPVFLLMDRVISLLKIYNQNNL